MNKLLVICGPTATGKSDLAVKLAKLFDGEVISADSRQVYRGMDIGTGKITPEEMEGIPHYLLDVADPAERFAVVDWKGLAEKAAEDILARQKLPIICGGTGYYIASLVDDIEVSNVKINTKERAKLEAKSTQELYEVLKKVGPRRASEIDFQNKRRLVNALLLANRLGKVPVLKKNLSTYDSLQIGIIFPDEKLKERIKKRLVSRIENGMVEEAVSLHKSGLSFKRMNELGLEYRYLSLYLQKKITQDELVSTLSTKIWQYAKRQKTWFKKDKRIYWFDVSKEGYSKKIEKLVKKWYASK